MSASAQDIINGAQQKIAALQAADVAINTQIQFIKNTGLGALTPEQVTAIAALHARQKAVLSASAELSLVAMTSLDNSDDLKKLQTALTSVAKDLNAHTAQIAEIDSTATNVGAISTAIGKLASQLQSFKTT